MKMQNRQLKEYWYNDDLCLASAITLYRAGDELIHTFTVRLAYKGEVYKNQVLAESNRLLYQNLKRIYQDVLDTLYSDEPEEEKQDAIMLLISLLNKEK